MKSTTETRPEAPRVILKAVASWTIAAMLVTLAHQTFSASRPLTGFALSVGTLLLISFVQSRIEGDRYGLHSALLTGAVWLTLTLLVEISITLYTAHGWFGLLGERSQRALRNALLLAWMFVPALFAKRTRSVD